jgi:CubicO group peptidase (beta-lactamase class C family)
VEKAVTKKVKYVEILIQILFMIVLSSLLVPSSCAKEGSTAEYIERIIETKFVDENLVVGVSIAVYEDDESVFYNFGFAKKELSEAVTSNHIFEIGSITKIFTTTILADMINRGIVTLEDPVADHLPINVKLPQRDGKRITLLDLATHRSGLPRNPTNMPPKHLGNPFAKYSVEDMYDFLGSYKLTRDISTEFEYSNIGMGLLGHVLSLKADKSYKELVGDVIFSP